MRPALQAWEVTVALLARARRAHRRERAQVSLSTRDQTAATTQRRLGF